MAMVKLYEEQLSEMITFDGNEVGLALVGDGFGQKSFTTTGRAVEEDTARRGHAKLEEFLRMLDWVLNQLLQFLLDTLQASDILPADVGYLHDSLSQGTRCRFTHSKLFHSKKKKKEVVKIHAHFLNC